MRNMLNKIIKFIFVVAIVAFAKTVDAQTDGTIIKSTVISDSVSVSVTCNLSEHAFHLIITNFRNHPIYLDTSNLFFGTSLDIENISRYFLSNDSEGQYNNHGSTKLCTIKNNIAIEINYFFPETTLEPLNCKNIDVSIAYVTSWDFTELSPDDLINSSFWNGLNKSKIQILTY